MAKEKRLGVGILAVILAALLVLTACTPRPPVEEKRVPFALIMPITGPVSAITQQDVQATDDYVRYFNEQEAIPGVRIEYLWRDSAYQLPIFLGQYEKLVAAGVPLIRADEYVALMGIMERFERDEVVILVSAGGCHELFYPVRDWIYTITPVISEQYAVVLEYFMENWKEERAPRLILMYFEGLWGSDARYATEYARSLGFEVLPHEVGPHVILDATGWVLRMKEARADLVYLQLLETAAGPVMRDAERLGLLDQCQFAGHSGSMGELIMKSLGVASEGYLTPSPFPSMYTETEVSGIKLMTDNQMKYHGKVERHPAYTWGWIAAAVGCEAIKRAIENVGYENLDGPAVKEALDGMKDFDVYGLMSITYKPDDHRGATKVAVYEVIGGEQVRVSDWRETPSACDWELE